MDAITPATCAEAAVHHDLDASQTAQDADVDIAMPDSVGEGHDNAGSTLKASVEAQPAPANETAEAHVDTNQPENSLKRQDGASKQEEQETANERREINEPVPDPLAEAKAIATAIAQAQYDAKLAAAVERGRLMCVQLCAKLYTTLPRELRDWVYGEIIGPYNREIVTGHNGRSGAIKSPNLQLDILNHEIARLPSHHSSDLRWWLDSYMGNEVALEIVEHWYRTRTFCFSRRRLSLIPGFVGQDVFSKGLEPGRFIQHIHAHLGETDVSSSYFDELKDRLCMIKNKNINLHIRLPYRVTMADRCVQLEGLSRIVYQLRNEGLSRITVQSSGATKDFTSLFAVQETLFKDHLAQWRLTANPNI